MKVTKLPPAAVNYGWLCCTKVQFLKENQLWFYAF